jgi:hypothetical protein
MAVNSNPKGASTKTSSPPSYCSARPELGRRNSNKPRLRDMPPASIQGTSRLRQKQSARQLLRASQEYLTRAPLLRISLATPVRSKLGKCYSDAKIYRCLRRDRSELPIGHPLSCNKQAHRGQSRANERSAYPDAEGQYGRRMSMPGQRPSGLRGSQVPFIPEMKCEHRLKKECILRWRIR